jgi:atypical dual specificity phosphatase
MTVRTNLKNIKSIAPDYPRIPHMPIISHISADDVVLGEMPAFPLKAWVQEKVDGANMRISWNSDEDAPILGNREHILRKGYTKDTPAKKQFVPAWNWIYDRIDFFRIMNVAHGQLVVYGDWMLATHSIGYDALPDWFVAYDVWSCDLKRFFSPKKCCDILAGSGIEFVQSSLETFSSPEEIASFSERPSNYRNGAREGIVLKTEDGGFIKDVFKVVNGQFVRRNDFNDSPMVKNKLIK